MKLDDTLNWLNDRGLPFQWRAEPAVENRQAILQPSDGNVLGLGDIEVAIVIPDVHLGVGEDVFQTADLGSQNDQRLAKFLLALADLRDEVGSEKFRVVQVGDWYDLYRAPLPTVATQIEAIESHYPEICEAARALPVFHCIGNHDAALYTHPTATKSRFGIVQPIGPNQIIAFHGNESRTLQAVVKPDMAATIGLSLVDLLSFIPLVGQIADFVQMVMDDSFQEPWVSGNHSDDLSWPKAKGDAPEGWQAPWVARAHADSLADLARGFESITDTAVQVVFVGHTHRPGISSAWISGERQVVLVDVGSWTYGRAEIAIVTADGVGLAAIPPG